MHSPLDYDRLESNYVDNETSSKVQIFYDYQFELESYWSGSELPISRIMSASADIIIN